MTGEREHAAARAGRLLGLLREAATASEPCPPDAALAERLDCTEEQVCDGFAFLEAAGMIGCCRVVTIRQSEAQPALPVTA